MLGALTSFCLMAIGGRELSEQMDTFQILFYRSLVGFLIISLVIIFTKQTYLLRSDKSARHVLRNLFHFGGQYGWFKGIALLPLAEVFALEFTVPLWTALIASVFLGEKLTKEKGISIMLGLLGVAIIVQPGIEIIDPASLIVLGAAICYAVAHSTTKSLSKTEHPLTIVFMMCLIQLPIAFIFSLSDWQTPVGTDWLWLVILGVTALSAHYCMTKAMLTAEVTMVVTMDFLRLPLIAIVGVFFYQENFEIALLIGASLMVGGNLITIRKTGKQAG
ncbi:EamA family transporter [Veronia nyctiphanis]|uniref:EamA family transporter n=1 Tax=Veronia nyctiphanis TaxID=1278244 RepID=A0A4Q0YM87_9GAMM|nr:DMT family transporter [Veronia nyctiphanis]RXJ71543.1 EamA family transporter [Veronia nyctiphanis]